MNVVKRILAFNAGRDPQTLVLKYQRMRADAFVFLRATDHLFYARLPDAAVLRRAPAAWACGDLHLENFGSYKGDNRLVYFDLNDFDEAVLAPASWDPLRLAASIVVGRVRLGLDETGALDAARHLVDTYADALAAGHARWIERETASGPVAVLLSGLQQRTRKALLDKRTQLSARGRRRRLLIDGVKTLAASDEQRERVFAFFDAFAQHSARPGFFRALDVARRIAGNASLGLERFVVLVEGKGSPDGNYLLDLKPALPSSLAGRTPCRQPVWHDEAERVVTVQRRMQAIPMAFLHAVRLGREPFILRGLQPTEDRVALDRLDRPALHDFVTSLGQCLAWAQLRSAGRQGAANADALIEFGQARKWRQPLLTASREQAAAVEADWKTYGAAYDAGAFRL